MVFKKREVKMLLLEDWNTKKDISAKKIAQILAEVPPEEVADILLMANVLTPDARKETLKKEHKNEKRISGVEQ